jgi:hypothetical protein
MCRGRILRGAGSSLTGALEIFKCRVSHAPGMKEDSTVYYTMLYLENIIRVSIIHEHDATVYRDNNVR